MDLYKKNQDVCLEGDGWIVSVAEQTGLSLIQSKTLKTCPEVIKLFSYSTQPSMKLTLLVKLLKYRQIKKVIALSLSNVVFIMLINVKIPTFGILTFMSRIHFVLS